jgi:hypothetical protein
MHYIYQQVCIRFCFLLMRHIIQIHYNYNQFNTSKFDATTNITSYTITWDGGMEFYGQMGATSHYYAGATSVMFSRFVFPPLCYIRNSIGAILPSVDASTKVTISGETIAGARNFYHINAHNREGVAINTALLDKTFKAYVELLSDDRRKTKSTFESLVYLDPSCQQIMFNFTVKQQGVYRVNVVVDNANREHIHGSPFFLKAKPDVSEPLNSQISSPTANTGEPAVLLIFPRDKFNNLRNEPDYFIEAYGKNLFLLF